MNFVTNAAVNNGCAHFCRSPYARALQSGPDLTLDDCNMLGGTSSVYQCMYMLHGPEQDVDYIEWEPL